MSDDLLCDMPATELARAIRDRAVSPVEAVEAVLARIERVDPLVNAFVTVTAEQALAAAREAERQVTATPAELLAPLHGVPITVKDLTDTAGVRTTYGSVAFKDHVPERDTLAWSRLKAAGAVLVGKTCTPEFGMLGVTESPLTGITNNPWDTSRTAGGSSGGAAAAVASGLAPLAWGSDGGGSIRIPAACCGVVGLKASTGRIPVHGEADVYGLVSTSGPLTRTVADAALMLQVTAGPDPHEPMALPAPPVPFTEALRDANVRGLRVAYSPDFGQGPVDPDVRDRFEQALRVFAEDLGAHVEPVDIDLPDAVQYFQDFWTPAFTLVLDELVEQGWDPAGSPPLFNRLAAKGRTLTAADHLRTSASARARISEGFAAVFSRYDLLLTPTMPAAVFPHPGPAAGPTHIDGQEVTEPGIAFHRLTEPPSHAGLPAVSVPCGFDSHGLPVGLQIIGPHHGDAEILRAAACYEAATEWSTRRPPLATPPSNRSRSTR